jgi:nucleoside-diphosphate-sugar epimerase
MKIFLIGATGFIGNAVAKRLLQEKHVVVGLVRSKEAKEKLQQQGIVPYLGTLDEPTKLLPMIKEADVVIYAAYGYEKAERTEQELLSGKSHLTDLLQAMHGSNKQFIFTSGTGVFPDTGDRIYTEQTIFTPINSSLNMARRALEIEVQAAAQHKVHSIVLRPPTAYGNGGSLMIPRFLLDHALKTGDSIYCTGTENNKWSAVHVDDLADLYLLAIDKAAAGSLYNAASESGITTLAIAESISRSAGLFGKTKAVSLEKAQEIFGHWANWWALNNQCSGEKAKTELGWAPSRLSMLADIEKGSYRV